jgi:hypothetical protein
MIPKVEAGELRLTVACSRGFAEEGRLADGYTCLRQGLAQARRAVKRGESWGADLILGYLAAEDEYINRFGVPIEVSREA